ncbi:MAG: class I SAM-dependent DNA methyltransferase [Planctomycetota bacterium]
MFDDVTDVYEAMIDWNIRLDHEKPFYGGLFAGVNAQRVLDVACGTGRHAAMFHSWGLQVEGADISPQMIARARAKFGEPRGLRWVVRGFEEPVQVETPFDAAICVGNSLALADDMAAVEKVLRNMFTAVRQSGLVILHVVNLWRLTDGPCHWQKCKIATLEQGDVLIIKGVHRSRCTGYVDLIVTQLDAPVGMWNESLPFLGLEAAEVERIARRAGASSVQFLGGYNNEAYDREKSVDLIVVAEK